MQEPSNLEVNYPVMVWTFYRYGALLVAIETTVCIRSCLNFKKISFWCHTFIFHIKFGNEYVYSKDKFWPKSPVVKYSPFLQKPGCPVLSVPSQYSVRCVISELHCLVTIFDGQAILSSDYFTH